MAAFENELTLDVSQFLKGVKVALGAADELQDFTIELDTEALQGASKAFSDLANDAKKSVSDIENSLAAMVIAGKEGTDEFKSLSEQLEIARANAKKMDDALASIKAPKIELDAFEQLEADAKKAQAEVSDVQKRLKAAIAAGDPDGVKQLRAELAKAQADAEELTDKVNKVGAEAGKGQGATGLGKLKESLSGLGGAGKELASGNIAGALTSIPVPQVAAAAAAVGAVTAGITAAVGKSKEFAQAQREVALQTGLSGESLEQLSDSARNAYIGGVGESASEALKIVGTLKQTLGDKVDVKALDTIAIRSNEVAKSLGIETPELVSKISPLIKQYGLTAEEALNLVASGAKNGVADLGGYLDSINEFTVNAKEAGFSAEEFFALTANGAAAGIKDFAKIGDGIKEVENRIKSGDLVASFAAVGGEIGKNLQGIAKLGTEGALSGKEVLQQSIAEIESAFASGQIDKTFRDKLLVNLGGSVAEDVGSDVYTKIFDPKNLNTESIKKGAELAGKQITDNIGQQDPFAKLSKSIDVFLEGAGKPILEAFNRIGDSLNKAFGSSEEAGDGIAKFGEIIGEVVVASLVPLELLAKTIEGIGTAAQEVSGFFGDIFGGDEAETQSKKTQKAVEDTKKKTEQANAKLLEDAKLLAKQGNLNNASVAELAKKYNIAEDEAKKLVDSSGEIAVAIKAAALETNRLSESFAAAQAAAGSAVGTNRQALAQLETELRAARKAGDKTQVQVLLARRKELLAAATDAVKTQRQLDRDIDANTFTTDPAARKAAAAARAQSALETRKQQELLNANLIRDVQRRELTILDIERNAALESLKIQKSGIDTNTVAGRQQVEELNKEIARTEKDFAQQRIDTLTRFEQERVQLVIDANNRVLTAIAAANERAIAVGQRQLEARNLTPENIQRLTDANVKAIEAGAEAEVRALIESLPEFQKARADIEAAISPEGFDADEAADAIKRLTERFRSDLLADTGDNPIGQQVRTIFANAEDASREAAKGIKQSIQDIGIQSLSSQILKGIDEQVIALERQRDLLLQNTALTEEQRKEIEQGYSKAIDKVRKGPLVGLRQSVIDIGTAIAGTTFDLGGEQAAADAAAVKEQVDAINQALREGKISYQEALDQINALQDAGESFLATFGDVLAQSLQATSEAVKTAAQASIDAYNQLLADQEKVRKDDTLSEEKRVEELKRLSELTAEQQAKALESIGVAAGANFATLLAQGTEVGDALKALASDTVKSLVALYTPTIIAASTSFLGPIAGPIAAGLAIAGIQALLDSALASFDVGGATGGRIGEVRGIVHGGEWVARPDVYKENKGLLDHLHKGGSAMDFLGREAISHSPSYAVNDAGSLVTLMSSINDTLGSLPAMVEVRQTDNVTLGLDDRLYERKRHKGMVRRLTR